ncbi:hypothetical protein FACS1894201_07000 [Bacteroidia bacterium]|nr:hypothetical protein FACS1894201_07000 [Bacteroidia bacterium]
MKQHYNAMNHYTGIYQKQIEKLIFSFRGTQVLLDRDLADMYDVEVKRLNEQVKRNIDRFPEQFRFQLSELERKELVANCDRFENLKHSTVCPYAFTEQGVAMLSAVLKSETAVKVSIQIMQAFVEMRKMIIIQTGLLQRVENIEKKQLVSDLKLEQVFKALENTESIPRQGIFYDGQIFDAYKFVSDLIKSAKNNIVLIDNYVDESVLTMLSKRDKGVKATIYTKDINPKLQLDLQKHNAQYPIITITIFDRSHDRFLIIDNTVYHIGASLKDLGKKWFAFTKMTMFAEDILQRLSVEN